MDPKGANLASTDLLEISQLVSGSYVTKSITGAEIISGATTGYVPYTGATQDLDLNDKDIYVNEVFLYDDVNDNYGSLHFTDTDFHIEDADGHKLLVIEDGFMQIHKTDTIQSNLFTSGLTATRDHYLPDASGTIALTSNLAGYVPTSRTLTINGTTQDLSADRTFTISTGITIGTTAITSGTVGRVLFEGTGNVVSQSTNLFWDNTNGRLGIGTSSPTQALNVSGFSVLTTSKTSAVPILAVTNTTSSNPNSNNFDCFAPNMPSASVLGVFYGGKNLSSRNNFGFNWNHVSDGSTGNSVSLEMVSVANIIRAWGTGNVGLNTGTDAGYKLDVNGDARVVGNLSVAKNQNGGTQSLVSNFNNNASAYASFKITSSSGSSEIGRFSASSTPIKIISASDTFIYSATAGDIALLNDFATGKIKFSAGASATAQMTIFNTGNVGINTTTDVSSSKLTIESTTQGVLFPRMTTTQKNAIASPSAGLMVYDTTLNLMALYNGTTWTTL